MGFPLRLSSLFCITPMCLSSWLFSSSWVSYLVLHSFPVHTKALSLWFAVYFISTFKQTDFRSAENCTRIAHTTCTFQTQLIHFSSHTFSVHTVHSLFQTSQGASQVTNRFFQHLSLKKCPLLQINTNKIIKITSKPHNPGVI